MKKLIILIIIIAAAYFGYNAINNRETPSVESIEKTNTLTGDYTGLYDDFSETLGETRQVVEGAGTSREDLAEAGIETTTTSFSDENDSAEIESDISTETSNSGPGRYVSYGDVALTSLEGTTVLDFYASWCPSCRKLEKDIKESLNDIPSDVTIVVVDYDDETALKTKYGVTRQHTLVQVDNQGNLMKKWSGGSTLESIIDELE